VFFSFFFYRKGMILSFSFPSGKVEND